MASRFRIRQLSLDRSVCWLIRLAVVLSAGLVVVPTAIIAQQSAQPDRIRKLYEMNDASTREYVRGLLDSGLPGDKADELILLTLNRSAIVVPELAARLEAVLANPAPSAKFVYALADILAYAGNEDALDSLIRLCQADSAKFGYFVRRTLDYSAGRRNPYTLIYHSLKAGQDGCAAQFAQWIDLREPVPNNDRTWAEAILKQYGHLPSDAELVTDPINARLGVPIPSRVRDELRNAKDVQPRN